MLAVAGIGNPSNFFDLLEKNKIDVVKKLVYPDHYQYSRNELMNIIEDAKKNNYEIVFTEKDFLRIKHYNLEDIKYLGVELKMQQKDKLIEELLKIYDKNF